MQENNNGNTTNNLVDRNVVVKKRKVWIDNLKCFACYGVLLGHCYSFFIGQNLYGQEQITSLASTILKMLSFVYNGDMWVIVFCMISGYLLSSKKITNFRELLKVVFSRYLRFVAPLALLAILIAVLNISIGFEIRSPLVANDWVGLPMIVNIKQLLKMVFLFDSYLDNPLWTVRGIFIGGIIVYLFNYLSNKFPVKRPGILIYTIALLMFIAGLFQFDALVCSCVIIGSGYKYIISQKRITPRKGIVIVGICVILLCGAQNLHCSIIGISRHFIVGRKWYVFYWFVILYIMISNEEITERLMGSKTIAKDSNHSFYVYILHFIILKTFINMIFVAIIEKEGYNLSCIVCTIICVVMNALFAFLFGKCFQGSILVFKKVGSQKSIRNSTGHEIESNKNTF